MSLSTFKTIITALLSFLAGLSIAAFILGLVNTGLFGLFATIGLAFVYRLSIKTFF